MRGARHDDQGHIGLNQMRQVFNFAEVIHAHLDYGVAMRVAQAQHHVRHADIVIKVAFGGEHMIGVARMRDQDAL